MHFSSRVALEYFAILVRFACFRPLRVRGHVKIEAPGRDGDSGERRLLSAAQVPLRHSLAVLQLVSGERELHACLFAFDLMPCDRAREPPQMQQASAPSASTRD